MSIKRIYGIKDLEMKLGLMTVGMFVKSFREAEGLSQGNFARKLGLSQANLCDIERGRKIPSPERAARLAKLLGAGEITLVQLAIQDSLRKAKLNYSIQLKAA